MFVIIDWGTTNFRADLLDDNYNISNSISSADGVLKFKKDEFYQFVLKILKKWNITKEPVIISGMAGSKNGWHESSYLKEDASIKSLANTLLKVPDIDENIYITSGVKIEKNGWIDVMRGEEIQVFGATQLLDKENYIAILPGTHSKWVETKNGKITDFKTNMSGEVFNQIASNTLLSKSIDNKEIDLNSFINGVTLSQQKEGVLSQIFQVRVQEESIDRDYTYSFLSGIIIGNEIKSMLKIFTCKDVVLVGSSLLCSLYENALHVYDIKSKSVDSKEAGVEAMKKIYDSIKRQSV